MARTNRRVFLAGAAALPAAAAMAKPPLDRQASVATDLDNYIGFGNKQAGGAGDNSCGSGSLRNSRAWVSGSSGRNSRRRSLRRRAVNCCAVMPRPRFGRSPSLSRPGPMESLARWCASIARDGQRRRSMARSRWSICHSARWSSALAKPIREPITAAFAAGAKAAVVITNGPTGKIIALNADGRAPMFARPVALAGTRGCRAVPCRGDAQSASDHGCSRHWRAPYSLQLRRSHRSRQTALVGRLDAAIGLVSSVPGSGAGRRCMAVAGALGEPGGADSQPRIRLQHGPRIRISRRVGSAEDIHTRTRRNCVSGCISVRTSPRATGMKASASGSRCRAWILSDIYRSAHRCFRLRAKCSLAIPGWRRRIPATR